jgi:hypothetical protein
MTEFPKYDWNAVAAGLPAIPDAVIRATLEAAPQSETLFGAWESMWKQASATMGLPTDDLIEQSKIAREVFVGFFKAEALRRGLS